MARGGPSRYPCSYAHVIAALSTDETGPSWERGTKPQPLEPRLIQDIHLQLGRNTPTDPSNHKGFRRITVRGGPTRRGAESRLALKKPYLQGKRR